MGSMIDNLFGGTNKEGIKAQREDNARRQEFIERQAGQARADVLNLTPGVDANRNMAYQQALDIYSQTIPQQLGTFQQGNVGGQGMLLAGMPQFQNAIFGNPVDYSVFQPQTVQYDSSYAHQQLPPFISSASLLGGTGPPPVSGSGDVGGLSGVAAGSAGYTGQQRTPADPGGGGLSGGQQYGNGMWFGSPLGPGDMAGGSGYNPFANTYDAPGYAPDNQGDIGSPYQLWLSENAGRIGSTAGYLSGIPGLGYLGRYLGDQNIANTTWMNPTDPANPYASQGSGYALVDQAFGNGELPHSDMPGQQPFLSNQAQYGSRGSISGGGAYGYASLLKPRYDKQDH